MFRLHLVSRRTPMTGHFLSAIALYANSSSRTRRTLILVRGNGGLQYSSWHGNTCTIVSTHGRTVNKIQRIVSVVNMNPSTPLQAARLLVYEPVGHHKKHEAKEHRPNLIRHASASPSPTGLVWFVRPNLSLASPRD